MSDEKKDNHPLDLTTQEAAELLFPAEAIDALKAIANPDKKRVAESEDDCEKRPQPNDA